MIPCPYCAYTFSYTEQHLLQQHLQEHDKEKVEENSGPENAKENKVPESTRSEAESSNNELSKNAPENNSQVTVKVSLRNEMEIEAKVSEFVKKVAEGYECNKCCQKGPSPSHIKRHAEGKHLTGYTHQCPQCSYKTNTRHMIKSHLKTHNIVVCK